jgi:hypothetical protein
MVHLTQQLQSLSINLSMCYNTLSQHALGMYQPPQHLVRSCKLSFLACSALLQMLGGVVTSGVVGGEYGRMPILIQPNSRLYSFQSNTKPNVWMSHGDEATQLPEGFKVVAKSEQVSACVCCAFGPWMCTVVLPQQILSAASSSSLGDQCMEMLSSIAVTSLLHTLLSAQSGRLESSICWVWWDPPEHFIAAVDGEHRAYLPLASTSMCICFSSDQPARVFASPLINQHVYLLLL